MKTSLGKDQMNELIKNTSFRDQLEKANGTEAVLKVFADHGIELTAEEFDLMTHDTVSGELKDADLEKVSGGSITWDDIKGILLTLLRIL
ncbi:Nif11-like leader peptide family RiPP precursor [Christensenellaceae bacterium OttesenSCG-928-K19]|nr:Nif11-like leader peptide family RiPP precursor [Christensenellaceae bacterium OttesenSCG-928-K19]